MDTFIPVSRGYIIQIASIHTGVGISIVTISSFVNSEMKFLGWESSIISIYFGLAILFELSRLFAGYLHDKNPRTQEYIVFGTLVSVFGLILTPYAVTKINSLILILCIALYYFGTAITTTVVDSYLTSISHPKERNRVSGTLQFARLLGFAIGGILGSITYSRLSFDLFIINITVIYVIIALITIISLNTGNYKMNSLPDDKRVTKDVSQKSSVQHETENNNPWKSLRDRNVVLLSIFLSLFSIGLFMQDLILEPFAIEELGFEKSDVGRLVAIWGIITLVFVPVGSTLEPRIGKLPTILAGLCIAAIGMATLTLASNFHNTPYFYVGLVIFSAGGGMSSGPAISIMLDLCYLNPKNMSFLLGFFGIIVTVGRSVAAIVGGIILDLSDDNFTLLFAIETIFVILSLLPIIPVSRSVEIGVENSYIGKKHLQSLPSFD